MKLQVLGSELDGYLEKSWVVRHRLRTSKNIHDRLDGLPVARREGMRRLACLEEKPGVKLARKLQVFLERLGGR